jgi:chromate transporter
VTSSPAIRPAFGDAFRFWLRLGFINFGGPTAQIAIMHDELVERRRWIDEDRFLHALSFCMLLPGPEAQQLAIYVGWLLNGTAGGIAAGVLFVVPAAVMMLGLAYVYSAHGDLSWVAAVFDGLSAAVVGIVFAATIAIAGRAFKSMTARLVAVAVFLAIFIVGVPFPLVVASSALAGLAFGPARLGVPGEIDVLAEAGGRPSTRRTVRVLIVGLAAWWVPIGMVAWVTGVGSVFTQEGLFFSQVAVVTFGGAYAVLAYVGQEVVRRFALTPADVVAGLGLAETTPGPLILVLEFLGFVAAYRAPGDLPPVAAGVLGATVTLWATFAPSFLFIFLGAPWVEHLRANRRLRGALAAITAAVVGVIASLGITMAAVVLFDEVRVVSPIWASIPVPDLTSLNTFHLVIAVAAFVSSRRYRVSVVWIVLASAGTSLAWSALR